MAEPKRRLVNWIDGFEKFTEGFASPALFRRWGAIMSVAGALERKVWITTNMGDLFPNLYVILVAPPAVGKTVVTKTVREFWSELDDHHISSSSVTKASLVDELREAERRGIINSGGFGQFHFNSLKVLSNEMGTLIPGYDNDFMNVLTDIYDGHGYSERRRSKDVKFSIDKPQLNILAATTPDYLNNVMPEGAWGQGFISRVIMIYSGQTQRQPLWGTVNTNEKLHRDLTFDLNALGKLYGKMKFESDAAQAISEWHLNDGPPTPDHPRLQNYNGRRTSHLLKLCMVSSASAGNSLTITLDNYTEALDWLIEAETYMEDIFKAMNSGGDSRVMEETWHFTYKLYISEKKPIIAGRIINFIQSRTPAHNVLKILEVMERSNLLQKQLTSAGDGYIPLGKT